MVVIMVWLCVTPAPSAGWKNQEQAEQPQ